jgi:hypothetical protein
MFEPLAKALESFPASEATAAEADRIQTMVGPSAAIPATLASPARFPAPAPTWPPVPSRGAPVTLVPKLPELPAGDVAEACRAQIRELQTLLRRRAVPELGEPAGEGAALGQLEERRRALFLVASAALVDELESDLARLRELSSLVEVPQVQEQLLTARETLAGGDLFRADELLRRSSDALERSEDEWTEIRILVVEAQLLEETLRELGDEPGSALGPILEAHRVARHGDRVAAERLLARGALALWLRLSPLLARRLQSIRDGLDFASLAPGVRDQIRTESGEIGRAIARRNFGAAILAYRRLRDATEMEPAERAPLAPSH